MVRKVAWGGTGLALTTGAVAAGVALSNRKTRLALKRRAKKTLGRVKATLEEGADRYQAYQHRIGMGKGKPKPKGGKKRRG